MGAVRGYMEVPHNKKWIRWWSYQEWYELYCDVLAGKELYKYFDLFLNGISNDFEKTPTVRWSALQFGDKKAIDNIECQDSPVPGTTYQELLLHSKTSNDEPARSQSVVSHDSKNSQEVDGLTRTFSEKTRLIGLLNLVLYMSCDDHNDMNVFVNLRKRDEDGNLLLRRCFHFHAAPVNSIAEIAEKECQNTNIHTGSTGVLRASHRAFDAE